MMGRRLFIDAPMPRVSRLKQRGTAQKKRFPKTGEAESEHLKTQASNQTLS